MNTSGTPRVAVVIPARMGSTRFPGKPLIRILGLPMIEHVYRRSAMAAGVDDVVVATCDQEIARAVEAFGGRIVMTSDRHERASDRVAEAAGTLDHEIVVMVQGDEPALDPSQIEAAVQAMLDNPGIGCLNLAAPFESVEEMQSLHTIKVVTDRAGRALFFTRQAVPTRGAGELRNEPVVKQVCVIPFRREALREYAALEPTPLEKAESVDMLRFLEHGRPVHMIPTAAGTHAVDVPADVAVVEALLADDSVASLYLHGKAGEGA